MGGAARDIGWQAGWMDACGFSVGAFSIYSVALGLLDVQMLGFSLTLIDFEKNSEILGYPGGLDV